ncbi:NADPH:quinone oxidoreductase family protein [Azospirillum sp.]|uniref:NADPH:quinone oxidoreductase family protein n=1 Tax=Azospirillum sp. TaxID=34012 RepID=UPI003D754B39
MKAMQCTAYGDPPELRVGEIGDPVPGPGEVLIAVEAVGLGYFDAVLVSGKYQEKPPLPFVPGREHAGRVVGLGDGVDPALLGARVAAIAFQGALAERSVAHAAHCLILPPGMDAVTAGSLLSAYATSLYALETCGALRAGETVLVLGGAGTVGAAAIDVAKALGGRVVAAASSDEKRAYCRRRGADMVIDYTQPAWRDALRELVGGVDVIVDTVGGPVSEPAFRSINPGGRHLVVGFASGEIPRMPLNLALLKRGSIVGVDWGGFMQKDHAGNRALMGRLRDLLCAARLHPEPTSVHQLDEVGLVLRSLVERRSIGKPVIDMRA